MPIIGNQGGGGAKSISPLSVISNATNFSYTVPANSEASVMLMAGGGALGSITIGGVQGGTGGNFVPITNNYGEQVNFGSGVTINISSGSGTRGFVGSVRNF